MLLARGRPRPQDTGYVTNPDLSKSIDFHGFTVMSRAHRTAPRTASWRAWRAPRAGAVGIALPTQEQRILTSWTAGHFTRGDLDLDLDLDLERALRA